MQTFLKSKYVKLGTGDRNVGMVISYFSMVKQAGNTTHNVAMGSEFMSCYVIGKIPIPNGVLSKHPPFSKYYHT